MGQPEIPARAAWGAGMLFLLPLLLFGTTIANWVAVDQAVDAAMRHNADTVHYFIETYGSGMRTVLTASAVVQAGIAGLMLYVGTAVLAGRRVRFLAVAVPWLAVCCGVGALTVNPAAKVRWAGEPDGLTLVDDHFPAWNRPVVQTLLTLTGLCMVAATMLFATMAVRPRDPA